MNILETAVNLAAAVVIGDKVIEATPVGETETLDVPETDMPVRLKGNKHIHIVGLVYKRVK